MPAGLQACLFNLGMSSNREIDWWFVRTAAGEQMNELYAQLDGFVIGQFDDIAICQGNPIGFIAIEGKMHDYE